MNQSSNDTICAIATAPGGAIGIIRVSGPDAICITDSLFVPGHSGKPLSQRASHTLAFGSIVTPAGKTIDEVLVSIFRAPHSYTGEDCTELSCHGSAYVLQQIMQLLVDQGCRTAQPGEYTQRAFLNGKMDLSQAEAVADLIASTSAATHRLAVNQMRGGFSQELHRLREQLIHIASLMELELDFSDHEDLEFADRRELNSLAEEIEKRLSHLVQSFRLGNALKNGIPVAIVGETNAGKSTLLNALLNEDRAIVSDIHGTTRDVIEETINWDGITFRFIDTAGIRQTDDAIESIGIERTFQKLDKADIVLWMMDCTTALFQWASLSEQLLPRCEGKQLLLLLNKVDLLPPSQAEELARLFKQEPFPTLFISAKDKHTLEPLRTQLLQMGVLPQLNQEEIVVTNLRHYEALSHALDAIHRVQDGLQSQLSGDLVSQDLRECTYHLGSIIGEISSSDILESVFSRFCIGK
ncbi:MAG: tRNA uridine-5-carboxymethylaminomethyl(34) synthesis GTPase MnmE [Bacteroidaceae bacterium]